VAQSVENNTSKLRQPMVSILIPVYNGADHLCNCLDSALGQTFRNIEVVCVDDGSTDESPAVLAEFAARDSRLVVFTQKNCGALHARSVAAHAARGEYFLCLDDDDTFRPNIVERAVAAALEKRVDVVEFSCTIRRCGFFKRRELYQWGSPEKTFFEKILRQPTISLAAASGGISCLLWNKLIRREVFLAGDGEIPPEVRATKISHRSDELLCSIILSKADSYAAISDIGCDYTIWPSSLSWQERISFDRHMDMLDEFFLVWHILVRTFPPKVRNILYQRCAIVLQGYTQMWWRFSQTQCQLALRRLMDGCSMDREMLAAFVDRIFGQRRVLKGLLWKLHGRRFPFIHLRLLPDRICHR
jgi:glycosyltransferase involved in cell wall biosynthesis